MSDNFVVGLAFLGLLYAINDTEYRMARNALRNNNNPRQIMNRFKGYNSVTGEDWQAPAMMVLTAPLFYFLGTPGREVAICLNKQKTKKDKYENFN